MKLSTKGRYGTRLMIDIAIHEGEGPVLLRDCARRQKLSEKYLGHLAGVLKNAKLIRSIRGAKGGYILARPASSVNLFEIVTALEGSLSLVGCIDDKASCDRVSFCASRKMWERLSKGIRDMMEPVTLKALAEEQKSCSKDFIYNI